MNDHAVRRTAAIAVLRSTIERFISTALQAEKGDPVATKKMLEISIEVQPAMENVVKMVTNREVK